jgi:hypothetical protein
MDNVTNYLGSFGVVLLWCLPILSAIACVEIARRKGLTTVLWGFLGFFFTLAAVLVVLVIPGAQNRNR